MNLKPLADRVVVSPIAAESVTPGGLHIPDQAKEKPREGVVMAVGPGRVFESGETRKPEVEVGDRVIYGQYGGTEITIDGESYLILTFEDILGVREQ